MKNRVEDNINKKKKIKNAIEWVLTITSAVVISLIVCSFIQIVKVNGDSMNNTLENGQRLFVYKKAYKENAPNYGDIIITKETTRHKSLIKRVIGTEGDKIQIIDNQVYINGEKLVENYIKEEMVNNEQLEIVIPKGFVFVMGDNRNNSLDSRNKAVGLIDYEKEIIGKVLKEQ